MKLSKNWPLLLVLAVSVSIISCQNGNEADELRISKGGIPVGGEITLAIPRLDISLDPSQMNRADASFIGTQIHGTLVRAGSGDINPMPCLAERWELDESGTTWVFHLRKDMMFQSTDCLVNESKPVTATHVVNSLTSLCGNGSEGAFFDSFRDHVAGARAFFEGTTQTVTGIQPLDDYTVKITLNEPNEAFLYLLTEPACAIVHPCGDGKIVASGAYRPSYSEGKLMLHRNPNYPLHDEFGNSLPYLDEVKFEHYPTKEAEIEAFFAGELDAVTNVYPDPISGILESHIEEFSGSDAKYVIQRNGELASYDLYTLARKEVKGFSLDYQGRPDLAKVTLQQ